jgi:xanthine dehydrogenase small subunit
MTDAPRHPRFLLDGEIVEARDATATTTLLEYLRGPLGRCGTKEGCAEGDCGACTVVVGESHQGRAMRYRAVNSCIRFVGTLDGKEVVTVESLRAPDGKLHPVQQAMVDAHASQCGFCTPGFVMSLFALYLARESVTRKEAVEALAGNLCRCTGYRPIIDAATGMHSIESPAHWPRSWVSPARLGKLPRSAQSLSMPGFSAPRTLDELGDAYAQAPDSLLLAGGTDIGLWVTKQLRDLPPIIFLGDVQALDSIVESSGMIEINAAAALTDAFAAIVARYPMLAEIANRFGSPPVRNAGTLCGNVANGSPIGDSMPALIALGSQVVLRHGRQERVIPLETLYSGYREKTLRPGEFVRAVWVPLPRAGRIVASYKISKRFDQDISAVCGAFAVALSGDVVTEARIAYGGLAAIPKRAAAAEAALQGKAFTPASVRAAVDALRSDFAPIDDMRASASYRMKAAAALLERFVHEHAPGGRATRVKEFSFGTAP